VHCDVLNADISVPCDETLADGMPLSVAVRPEKITISRVPPAGDDHNVLKGTVRDLGYFGDQSLYRVKLAGGTVLQVSAQNLKRTARLTVEWDDEVYLSWEVESTILLRS
jgi:putrescine transport system ATP-binding protein